MTTTTKKSIRQIRRRPQAPRVAPGVDRRLLGPSGPPDRGPGGGHGGSSQTGGPVTALPLPRGWGGRLSITAAVTCSLQGSSWTCSGDISSIANEDPTRGVLCCPAP